MNYSETYFELDSEEATHSHPLSPYLLCVHLRACANMCQCTLFDVGGVEIHSIECIEYCTKDQSNVEDVEDRSNTPKGCNAMYVEDIEDGKRTYTHILAHNFLNT